MKALRVPLAAAVLLLTGCPKQPLPAPPRVASGPAVEMLAKRDDAIRAIEADVVIRMRIPEGMDGAPGAKVRGHVLSADESARLDIWTPLGTLGAILLIADDQLQVYSPLENRLMKGPLDSKDLAARSPLPLPMEALPALLRGAVRFEKGEIVDATEEWRRAQPPPAPDATPLPPQRVVEVRETKEAGASVRQRVFVDENGGYPTLNQYFEDGKRTLTIQYLDYGGVETGKGPIAFPQKVKAAIERPEGTVSLEVRIDAPKVNPTPPADAFTLSFETPPRVEEFP